MDSRMLSAMLHPVLIEDLCIFNSSKDKIICSTCWQAVTLDLQVSVFSFFALAKLEWAGVFNEPLEPLLLFIFFLLYGLIFYVIVFICFVAITSVVALIGISGYSHAGDRGVMKSE